MLTVFPPPAQTKTKIININSASQNELTKILQISESLARKIITLRGEPGGFKDSKELTQLIKITTLKWEEWKEQEIIITVK